MNILDQALQQLRQWIDTGVDVKRLSINISESQLDNDFLSILVQKCNDYNISHDLICLEFSESSFMHCTEQQRDSFARLKSAGFYIIVDDFGLSSKSLGCLLQANINALKLHHSLMIEAQKNAHAKRVMDGIIALCNTMNIDIIAEGIESQSESDYLQSLDIHRMQGHYFTKPLLANDLQQLLNSNSH